MTYETAPRDFSEAIAYLSSFTDYEQKHAEKLARVSLDLGRMDRWTQILGRPHEAVPVVHVAGTKGKGSVTWMIEALLRAHGLRTGRFLSPHVEHVTERIAVDGESISEERFTELVARLHRDVEARRADAPDDLPSFFESMALMAFLEFADRRVDMAVMEVGLGGRLDATNVVSPEVGVITNIDLEHTRVLGDTLERIAAEKAGIIKPWMELVCGVPRDSREGEVIAEIAEERGAKTTWLDDVEVFVSNDGGMTTLEVTLAERTLRDVPVGPLGHHQATNAALAILAVDALERREVLEVRDDEVRRALGGLAIPARLELFESAHHAGFGFAGPILLDCAHTPGSMHGLAATTRRLFDGRRKTLLLGMLRDKRTTECLEALHGVFDDVVVIAPDSPRALEADALAAEVRDCLDLDAVTIAGLDELAVALESAGSEVLVVGGSIYLAGAVRRRLNAT